MTLWLPVDMTERQKQQILNSLDTYEERANATTGAVYHVGNLNNLRVRATLEGVSITGSLARFHLGSNLGTLTCQQTREAIERLSDALGQPVESARVTRMEFGSNLQVERRPVEYFTHLGEAARYQRSEINMRNGNGLYYSNGQRELAFYDKIRELKCRRAPVPEPLIGRNLLRYELRFLRKVGNQLSSMRAETRSVYEPGGYSTQARSTPDYESSLSTLRIGGRRRYATDRPPAGNTSIHAVTLYAQGFYHGLISRWKHEYLSIRRRNIIRTILKPIGGPKVFRDQLAALGLEHLGGVRIVVDMLQASKRRGEIESQHYKRNKRFVEELAVSSAVSIEPDLILELDRVISETAERFR